MTNTSKPIVFFGTEDFSARFLAALIEAQYDIRAVITKPDSKKGRGQHIQEPAVKKIAISHGIDVWQPKKLSEITSRIKQLQPIAGVLVSYGKIVPQSILDIFTPGIINVHPSLLPLYRGPSPIESAILHGDEQTGVSIMQLTREMDAGPVYARTRLDLVGTETKPKLYESLGELGAQELLSCLPSILDGSLSPTPQDDTAATYCRLLSKADSLLDPQQLTAHEAERHVRAFLGYPKSKLAVSGHELIVTKAHVTDQPKTPLDVQFRDGAYLAVDELIAPSGKVMNADAFLRGYAAGGN